MATSGGHFHRFLHYRRVVGAPLIVISRLQLYKNWRICALRAVPGKETCSFVSLFMSLVHRMLLSVDCHPRTTALMPALRGFSFDRACAV